MRHAQPSYWTTEQLLVRAPPLNTFHLHLALSPALAPDLLALKKALRARVGDANQVHLPFQQSAAISGERLIADGAS